TPGSGEGWAALGAPRDAQPTLPAPHPGPPTLPTNRAGLPAPAAGAGPGRPSPPEPGRSAPPGAAPPRQARAGPPPSPGSRRPRSPAGEGPPPRGRAAPTRASPAPRPAGGCGGATPSAKKGPSSGRRPTQAASRGRAPGRRAGSGRPPDQPKAPGRARRGPRNRRLPAGAREPPPPEGRQGRPELPGDRPPQSGGPPGPAGAGPGAGGGPLRLNRPPAGRAWASPPRGQFAPARPGTPRGGPDPGEGRKGPGPWLSPRPRLPSNPTGACSPIRPDASKVAPSQRNDGASPREMEQELLPAAGAPRSGAERPIMIVFTLPWRSAECQGRSWPPSPGRTGAAGGRTRSGPLVPPGQGAQRAVPNRGSSWLLEGGVCVTLRWGRTFLLGLGFFAISGAWALFNVQVPLYLRGFLAPRFPEQVNTLVGTFMILDEIAALFLEPYVGALSDRTRPRLGPRLPYGLVGMPLPGLAFIFLPYHTSLVSLIALVILFDFFMGIHRSPTVALMPDVTPEPLRSPANGVINLMGGLGGAVAFGVGA